MAECRSERCRREYPIDLVWLLNDHTRNRAPIDAVPNPEGNITIDRMKGTWHRIVDEDGEVPPHLRHKSHFATCKEPEVWRKRCEVCKQSPCIQGPACPKKRARGRPRKPKPAPGSIQESMF